MERSFFWTRQLHVDTCTKKSVLHVQIKVAFFVHLLLFFHRSLCLRRLALHDFIQSFAFSPGKIYTLIFILNFILLVDVAVIIIFFEIITKNKTLS